MTKKIFRSTVLVSAMILILGSAFVLGVLYQYFGKQLDGELEKEASYLAYGVEQNGVDYLEQIKQKDARITYMWMHREQYFMTVRQMHLPWKITVTVKKSRKHWKMEPDMRNECPKHCLKRQFIMR